jgi:hypothetical protein
MIQRLNHGKSIMMHSYEKQEPMIHCIVFPPKNSKDALDPMEFRTSQKKSNSRLCH